MHNLIMYSFDFPILETGMNVSKESGDNAK